MSCAACGLPGHRYGRNEGMERFDPMACINQLRGELERLTDFPTRRSMSDAEKLRRGIESLGIEMPEDWTSWDPLVSALMQQAVPNQAVADARRIEEER